MNGLLKYQSRQYPTWPAVQHPPYQHLCTFLCASKSYSRLTAAWQQQLYVPRRLATSKLRSRWRKHSDSGDPPETPVGSLWWAGASISGTSSSSGQAAGAAIPRVATLCVALALLPTLLWCVTWTFTGGMATLANTSMSGMCSLARLLYPNLPVRGVDYEDVAASLVKAIQSGTDQPSTWSRPGLWAPAWLLRALMANMFALAAGSSCVARALIPNSQGVAVSAISQGCMYAVCLLLMLPLGTWLNTLGSRAIQLIGSRPSRLLRLPPALLRFTIPRFDDTAALALKLVGILAWPCISAAALLQPSLAAANSFTANFATAVLQVASCSLQLVLLLIVAVIAGRFVWDLIQPQQQLSTAAVLDFGYQTGLLCAMQGVLNVMHMGLGLASGQMSGKELVLPVISTLILGRVVWSIWRLYRIGAPTPSMWLQLLSVAPGLARATDTAAGSN